MDEFNKNEGQEIFSKKIRAGKRTYFFDVKSTRGKDYFITITESKKSFEDGNYVKHKIFLYKEDFNKFVEALTETVNYIKTDLMPDYDFDEFKHENSESGEDRELKSN
ncbi:MAG: PUR family DNA/RNA-binding protein [Bacteroidia bacterium]|nr:PUR family DNA/RNA-binding protein [Bacteroidia bacterium]